MSNLITTSEDLTSVAAAIRSKGGTFLPLQYPNEFVSAINAIPTGGTGGLLWDQSEAQVVYQNGSVSGSYLYGQAIGTSSYSWYTTASQYIYSGSKQTIYVHYYPVTSANIGSNILDFQAASPVTVGTGIIIFPTCGPVNFTGNNLTITLNYFRQFSGAGTNIQPLPDFLTQYQGCTLSLGDSSHGDIVIAVVDYDAKILDVDTIRNVATKLNSKAYPLTRGVSFRATTFTTGARGSTTDSAFIFN